MAQKNTAELWDGVWARTPSVEKDLYAVRKEERLIRWQRIEAMVVERFGGFEGLSVVELGAGRGTNAVLMAQRGARVTVLDYSESALERARSLFDELGLHVELAHQDALDLPDALLGAFDISMSFGLAEHFLGPPRAAIVKAHFEVLRPGGLALISVPNARNPPYRLYKWVTERTGRWTIGEEYPFSRNELERHCRVLGIGEHGFFGDSLWRSKKFLNPIKWLPRRKSRSAATKAARAQARRTPAGAEGRSSRRARRLPRSERGTRFDDRYSYALVLWGVKPVPAAGADAAAQPVNR